ncbi:MAG: LysM peptidoglycan-binding domain-containing protein, partial [Limisphaerales bacterium]
AHLELALLYEEHMHDYAAAIYHYEKHLKLRPNSEYADRARERIKSCKMDLVKTEVLGPVNQGMQRELERLANENTLLKQRIETLEAQLTSRMAANAQLSRQSTAVPISQPISTHQSQAPAPVGTQPRPTPPSQPSDAPTTQSRENPTQRTNRPRVHIVKSGDKLTTIARDYGVELSALMRANPGVEATRLQIGQSINIP